MEAPSSEKLAIGELRTRYIKDRKALRTGEIRDHMVELKSGKLEEPSSGEQQELIVEWRLVEPGTERSRPAEFGTKALARK